MADLTVTKSEPLTNSGLSVVSSQPLKKATFGYPGFTSSLPGPLGTLDEFASSTVDRASRGVEKMLGIKSDKGGPTGATESISKNIVGGGSDVVRSLGPLVAAPFALTHPIRALTYLPGAALGHYAATAAADAGDLAPEYKQGLQDVGAMAGGYYTGSRLEPIVAAGEKALLTMFPQLRIRPQVSHLPAQSVPTPQPGPGLQLPQPVQTPWEPRPINPETVPPRPPVGVGNVPIPGQGPGLQLPEPVQTPLPSGRTPGPKTGQVVRPESTPKSTSTITLRPRPWWADMPQPTPQPSPELNIPKVEALPSGRIPGKPIAQLPIAQAPTPQAAEPTVPLSETMKTLPSINKFEMNRMAHARAQELELPGSPAGKNGHANLSQLAKDVFGKKSWSDLTVEQMRDVYDFMDSQKRLPKYGEIKP